MPDFDNYMKNNKKKLKKKIRKGIPDSLRGEVWMKISGTQKMREGRESFYNELINNIKEFDIIKIPDEHIIIRDMHRTFPKCLKYKNRLGDGQRELFRVLCCFSMKNKKVGYVQGMSFLVGVFLSYETEEKTFWLLENVMKNYHLRELYYSGFPGLKKNFFVFLKYMKKLLPDIYRKLSRNNIYPLLYACSWYITCFTDTLPFKAVVRIIDCFLMEGNKILLRFSLGILAMKENEILSRKNNSEIMTLMKNLAENIDVDKLFKKSFDFSISKKKILKYENLYKDYISGRKTGDEDIMSQINIE